MQSKSNLTSRIFTALAWTLFITALLLPLSDTLAQPGGGGGIFEGTGQQGSSGSAGPGPSSGSAGPGPSSGSAGPGPSSGSAGQSGGFQNPLRFNSIQEFFEALLEVIIQIGFPIVVIAIIWTGFLFVKAQGNPEELKTARRAFLATLVGALLILGAFVLAQLIEETVDEITFLILFNILA